MTRRYNGGIRDMSDLMDRCVVDDETGCWHLRDSKGRVIEKTHGKVPSVFLVNTQSRCSARRAAWNFTHPCKLLRPGEMAASTCRCWDCINPAHTVNVDGAGLGRMVRQDGRGKTPAKRANAVRQARSRAATRFTAELAQWVRDSSQNQPDAAHGAMTSQARVSDIRLGKSWQVQPVIQGASVFGWRGDQRAGAA